jgi:type II secretory pathway pseudopilin PulG
MANRRDLPVWVVVVVIGLLVVMLGGLWAYTQHASQVSTESIRQQVEEQMYREGELGHRPGEVPTHSTRSSR